MKKISIMIENLLPMKNRLTNKISNNKDFIIILFFKVIMSCNIREIEKTIYIPI